MAIRIRFDNTHNIIQPTFVLATRSGNKLGGIKASGIQLSDNLNSYFELSFRVYKYDNGVECRLWDQIKDFKLLWCPEWNVWFEINVEINEEIDIVKNVYAKSLGEAELSQINLYGIEINTENDILRDDYVPTVLYNEKDKNASLLDRILEKAPHYSIKHVDSSIAKIQRTFTFDGITIYDAFQEISTEIDCIFIINSGSNPDGTIERSISVYDLENYCIDCGERGDFVDTCPKCGSTNIERGYGDETAIYVSTENLAEGITYSTNVDSVKNCFRLEAGDDLMSATVRNCNPNGSDYLWYFSDETKSDMSPELVEKLEAYDKLYQSYTKDYKINLNPDLISRYNAIIDKYKKYREELEHIPTTITGYSDLMNAYYNTIDFQLYLESELMPSAEMSDTSAEKQAALLTAENLSPVAVADASKCSSATASSAVLSVAKIVVDSRYQVKVKEGVLERQTWTGSFVVTNYSDEDDTAESAKVSVEINDDYEQFVKQKLDKALDDESSDTLTLSDIFKLDLSDFKQEIQKYCLNSLNAIYDACRACVDILIQQGVADDETWATSDPDLYSVMYIPYHDKMLALEAEIKTRETEIGIVAGIYDADGMLQTDGVQTLIEKENEKVQDTLDFEKYLGTELWLEFAAYRREDSYTNENYISDGLNNAELFDLAREFIEVAQRDIIKSATLQHSISATLKNLLVMKEFAPIVDYFKVGNWIHVCINETVYHLRLISYQIDFDNLNTLSIEFSDVTLGKDSISDTASILSQAASIATSYGAVSRQAKQGKASANEINDWINDGLLLTKTKILDSAQNQDVIWDKHGLLCREYLPITESYDDRQLKIINRGLYLTDDNWRTARAGIGNFTYFDPETGETKEAYGVIADTLIGNLVLSEKVGIYNKSGSITLDDNGIILTTTQDESESWKSVFKIRKKLKDNTYEDVVYIDGDGNAHFNGIVEASSGKFNGDIVAKSLVIEGDSADDYVNFRISQSMQPIDEWIAQATLEIKPEAIIATVIGSKEYQDNISGITERVQAAEQKITPEAITSTVTSSEKYKGDIDGITGRLQTDESLIKQNADEIKLRVTSDDVSSIIDQKADSIRLKADKISWKSMYSELTEDGKLKCTGAEINGILNSSFVTSTGTSGFDYNFGIYSGDSKKGFIVYNFAQSKYSSTSNRVDWLTMQPNSLLFGRSVQDASIDDFLNNVGGFSDMEKKALAGISVGSAGDGTDKGNILVFSSNNITLKTKNFTIHPESSPGVMIYDADGKTYYTGYTGNISASKGIHVCNGLVTGPI